MLRDAGIETATAASGMTAFTLLQFATVAIVPVLLLPAVLFGILVLSPEPVARIARSARSRSSRSS